MNVCLCLTLVQGEDATTQKHLLGQLVCTQPSNKPERDCISHPQRDHVDISLKVTTWAGTTQQVPYLRLIQSKYF